MGLDNRQGTLGSKQAVHPSMVMLIALVVLDQNRPEPDWLPVLDAPRQLTNELVIAMPANPGPKIELKGRVFKADGKTPSVGTILYFHHTDGRGIYPRPAGADPKNWDYWHGILRGWLKTDAQGRFVLRTTRPAPYPGRSEPAHIHVYGLLAGSRTGFYFSDFVFQGDPLLTSGYWERVRRDGHEPYAGVKLTRGKSGAWTGERDLVLSR